MSRTYRVGVIGCGATSKFFLTGWKAVPDRATVVALCDIVPEQMARRKEEFPEVCGDAAEFTDYRDLLARADLDIACLCAAGDTRLEHTEACLAKGLHLFIEKPIGFNPEEARRFKFLALKHADRKVAVAYTLRYNPEWRALRQIVNDGTIGDVFSAQITYLHDRHIGGAHDPLGDLTDKMGNYIAASRCVHDTHPWDMARYLFGEARDVLCTEAPGSTMGLLEMASGALVYVHGGSQPKRGSSSNTHHYCVAHGTRGSAWFVKEMYPPHHARVLYRTDGETQEAALDESVPRSSHNAIYRTIHFLNAIEGKEDLISSMHDGALTTDLLHALWLSVRTQGKVRVRPAGHSG